MNDINKYIFNVFQLMRTTQQQGLLVKPKVMKIYYKDRKVLNNIYTLYKIYSFGITKRKFIDMVRNYSVDTGLNIIKSGNDLAVLLEKTMSK